MCEAATAQAAEYTSNRQQFGKPLSTFQGVQLRAADAFIDTECIRVTTMQAAWKIDEGLDASADVLVAKWWASEAGQHAVHNTQHLHGGMGADIDYPIHRYFLWGKQIEDTLGGASVTLAGSGRSWQEREMTSDHHRPHAVVQPEGPPLRGRERGRRAADAADRADAHAHRGDRDRVARLPGRPPRPGARAGARLARHLHEHPHDERVRRPLHHRLGGPERACSSRRRSAWVPRTTRATR